MANLVCILQTIIKDKTFLKWRLDDIDYISQIFLKLSNDEREYINKNINEFWGVSPKINVLLLLYIIDHNTMVKILIDKSTIECLKISFNNNAQISIDNILSRYLEATMQARRGIELLANLAWLIYMTHKPVYLDIINSTYSHFGLYCLLRNLNFEDDFVAVDSITNPQALAMYFYMTNYLKQQMLLSIDKTTRLLEKMFKTEDIVIKKEFCNVCLKYPSRIKDSLSLFAKALALYGDDIIVRHCALSFSYNVTYHPSTSPNWQLIAEFINILEDNNSKLRKYLTDLLHARRENEFVLTYLNNSNVNDNSYLLNIIRTDFCFSEIYYLSDNYEILIEK